VELLFLRHQILGIDEVARKLERSADREVQAAARSLDGLIERILQG
jgi:hypothetical protein